MKKLISLDEHENKMEQIHNQNLHPNGIECPQCCKELLDDFTRPKDNQYHTHTGNNVCYQPVLCMNCSYMGRRTC